MKTFYVTIFNNGANIKHRFSYKAEDYATARAELLLKYKCKPIDLWINDITEDVVEL